MRCGSRGLFRGGGNTAVIPSQSPTQTNSIAAPGGSSHGTIAGDSVGRGTRRNCGSDGGGLGGGGGSEWIPGVCASYAGSTPNCSPGYWSNPSGGCWTCSAGGTPVSGGGGGGGPIATTNPQAGMSCDNSPGQLGTTNLASQSGTIETGQDSTVNDIFGLKPSPSGTTAYAWVYTTFDGDIFIQYNPAVGGSAAATWVGNVLSGVPFAGPGVAATITAIVNTAANPKQITSSEWSVIQQSINAKNQSSGGTGPVVHACFAKPLSPG